MFAYIHNGNHKLTDSTNFKGNFVNSAQNDKLKKKLFFSKAAPRALDSGIFVILVKSGALFLLILFLFIMEFLLHTPCKNSKLTSPYNFSLSYTKNKLEGLIINLILL